MTNEARRNALLPVADRKKMLIAQGAVFRAQIMNAKEITHASLRPDSLARSALNHVGLAALAAIKGRSGPSGPSIAGIDVRSILPLLLSGISMLSKNSSLKPAMRGALAAGAVGIAAAVVWQKKKAQR
jgi:hypothetical protein